MHLRPIFASAALRACRLGGSLCVGLGLVVSAAAETILQSYPLGLDIPDDRSTGLLDTRMISAVNPVVTGISLDLQITPAPGQSAFLGDLYAYVQHGEAIAVLLNRPGRRAGEPAGYDDNQSLSVTFLDGSADIHSYRTSPGVPIPGPLVGIFAPDGRATDPASVLDTDARTLGLAGFLGADANGAWSLFVGDLSGGAVHRLESWGLRIETGPAGVIPESGAWPAALLVAALAGGRWWTRRRQRRGATDSRRTGHEHLSPGR